MRPGICIRVVFAAFTRSLLLALVLFSGGLQAQPRVMAVFPKQNEIHAAATTSIRIAFSEPINAGTIDASTWQISGSQSGQYDGVRSYDVASLTAEFVSDQPFKPGERIYSNLTSGIQNAAGLPLTPAFQSWFTTSVEFGTGVFDETVEIALNPNAGDPVDRDPLAIFSGDFNNDLFVDLAVANNSSNTISILINNFASFGGSFQVASSVAAGNGPTTVTGSDFDNDGFLDLAVGNFDDNTISLLRNDGTGNFTLSQSINTAEHPTVVQAHDFNNDGRADLAAVVLGINRLQIFLNQGAGTFSLAPITYGTGASPYGLAAGDFDNDGDIDIVVSNSGDNSIFVFKNKGQSLFANTGEVAVSDFPTAIQAQDLVGRSNGAHGDGILDLVLVHPNINAVSVLENRSIDGAFVPLRDLDAGLRPSGLFAGDIDTSDALASSSGLGKEHDIDLVVPNLFSNDVFVIRNQFNNSFNFDPADVYNAGQTPSAVTGADFDRDGDLDLAVTNQNSNQVTILLNRGGDAGDINFTLPNAVIDFGQVSICSDSTRSFSITNPTDETVVIDEISTTLPVFVATPAQAEIAPGEVFTFAITFAPIDTVAYQDSLRVRGQILGRQQEIAVGLRGEGIQAIISAAPDTLDFAGLLPPQTGTLSLQLNNSGNGPLVINALVFSDPAFSSDAQQLTVPPHSSLRMDISFTPAEPIAYLDTLTLVNNDCLDSALTVILLGGPNNFPPVITSPDTVTAIEDSLFSYEATATDSDGTQPRFSFSDLPRWLFPRSLLPDNSFVDGTPLEGDLDTTFTVIASDGIFADTVQVYVRVIPVNDPPRILPVIDQTVVELDILSFDLTATDPEDSSLVFSVQNLPAGAGFIDNGNKTASFTWVPPAGSAGTYDVTFVVTEAFEAVPLSDTAIVRINVLEALPDLSASSLGLPTTDIALNQTLPVTGVVQANFSDVETPFRLTFLHDGSVARDTLVSGLALNEQISFTYNATFDRLEGHEIIFRIDRFNQVQESNEENNDATLLLQVSRAQLIARPNPFTPNQDGFNDEVVFDFSDFSLDGPELKIFSFRGAQLLALQPGLDKTFRWNGRDRNGRDQMPGVYLYVLSDNKKRVSSGYIVLAR